jgi:hypothetical protein
MFGICAIWGKQRLPIKPLKRGEQSQTGYCKPYYQRRIQSLLIYQPFSTDLYYGRRIQPFLGVSS